MTSTDPQPRQRLARLRARVGSRRTQALASLGLVAALATGLSVQGTWAYWTDDATLTTGTFSSGTLDITLDGALSGQGGTITRNGFALTNMVPGESQAFSMPVANPASATAVGLTYTITGTATGGLAPTMQWAVYAGSSSNTGTAAAGNRTGSCSGALLSTSAAVVLGGTSTPVVSNARTLAAGASENVCIVAKLNPSADNSAQGKSVTGSLVFNAQQVGAP